MTTTPRDKEQALPQFHMTENGPRHRSMVTWSGVLADCGPMTVAHLSAQIAALDPSTRATVLREAIPESDWARISDEDDEAAQRFLEMSDEELDAAIVAAGGDPERHRRASQAIGRWARKLAEMHGELTTARAEVERLRALVKLALSRGLDNAVSEPLRAALDAPDPLGPVNYGMDSDE